MSTTTVLAAAAPEATECAIVPLFVCAGCRPQPLGYAMIGLGDALDEIVACPMRDVCTWHAAHDLGGRSSYNEQPDGAILTPLFRNDPYFSCPNLHDHAKFLSGEAGLPAIATTAVAVARRGAEFGQCATPAT